MFLLLLLSVGNVGAVFWPEEEELVTVGVEEGAWDSMVTGMRPLSGSGF